VDIGYIESRLLRGPLNASEDHTEDGNRLSNDGQGGLEVVEEEHEDHIV
jgi:hypothetical protein